MDQNELSALLGDQETPGARPSVRVVREIIEMAAISGEPPVDGMAGLLRRAAVGLRSAHPEVSDPQLRTEVEAAACGAVVPGSARFDLLRRDIRELMIVWATQEEYAGF